MPSYPPAPGHPPAPGYPPAPGQPAPEFPSSLSPSPPPLTGTRSGYFFLIFSPSFFRYSKGWSSLYWNFMMDRRFFGLPGRGLQRALVTVSRVWPPPINVKLITIAPPASAPTRPSPYYVAKRPERDLEISRPEGKRPPGKEIGWLSPRAGNTKTPGRCCDIMKPRPHPAPGAKDLLDGGGQKH